MPVHEDPDELGYFQAPLSRSKAQGDLGDVFALEGAERHAAGALLGPESWASYTGQYLYDLMPAPKQAAIVKAAQHPERSAIAEQYRAQAGYSFQLDPGWG
jgi:hypothetical protein